MANESFEVFCFSARRSLRHTSGSCWSFKEGNLIFDLDTKCVHLFTGKFFVPSEGNDLRPCRTI